MLHFGFETAFTILSDIASRVMHATEGSPKTVAGAVAIETLRLVGVRNEVSGLPKWGKCTLDDAAFAVDLVLSQATAASIVSVDRDTEAWRRFLADAEVLQKAIVLSSKKVAGWAKPTTLLKFVLLGSACAMSTGHALGTDRGARIVGTSGRQLIECSTICDTEVEGKENLEVFESFWSMQRVPTTRLARMGIELISNDVRVTTEQLEPCLLLADYIAGLGLAAVTPDPGRLPLPIDQDTASKLLSKLRSRNKLVTAEEEFDHSYDEIFRDVMDQAREHPDA